MLLPFRLYLPEGAQGEATEGNRKRWEAWKAAGIDQVAIR
jgi:hypothetical protein